MKKVWRKRRRYKRFLEIKKAMKKVWRKKKGKESLGPKEGNKEGLEIKEIKRVWTLGVNKCLSQVSFLPEL